MGMKRRLKGTCMQHSRIFGVFMIRMSMKSEKNHLENFFRYFSLTPAQKCHYAQMKLAGEAYWWWKDDYIECRHWFVLQDLFSCSVCSTPRDVTIQRPSH